MRWSIVSIGLVLILLFSGVRLADPGVVQSVRFTYFDTLQKMYPRDWQDLPVRVVDLDERSLAEFGQWPWPRTILATLTDQLRSYGAAVVAFDTLFAEPDRYSPSQLLNQPNFADLIPSGQETSALAALDNDLAFAQSIANLPVVLGIAAGEVTGGDSVSYDKAGFVQIGSEPLGQVSKIRQTTPIVPVLAEAANGIASINLSPLDQSGVVRRVPLLWQTDNGPLPSLSVETLRLGLAQDTYIARGLADVPRAMSRLQLAAYEIPTNAAGEMWVYFRKDDERLYVSASDVLNPTLSAELGAKLQGHLVLVGTSAAGLLDIRTTALRERVPGVSIHAQLLEQILTDQFLTRSDVTAFIELLSFVSLGLILTLIMSRYGPLTSMATGTMGALAVIVASLLFFNQQGVLFDASFPILAGMLTYGILTAFQFYIADREKRMIRQSFGQYLAPSVLAEIERKQYKIELGGEMKPVTVMFSDIRNFTPLAEKLSPPELVSLLNELFSTLTENIQDEGGTIDKYIGDNVMAFWNAPLEMSDHTTAAARAALKMRQSLSEFCSQRDDLGQSIELATGLASGEVLVGNIGSRQRFNYSVLGDTVNVASRTEAACRLVGFDIVATSSVAEASPELAWLFAGHVALKGKTSSTPLYILLGDETVAKSDEFASLRDAHSALLEAIKKEVANDELLSECRKLAAHLDVSLTDFYDKLANRLTDFRVPH